LLKDGSGHLRKKRVKSKIDFNSDLSFLLHLFQVLFYKLEQNGVEEREKKQCCEKTKFVYFIKCLTVITWVFPCTRTSGEKWESLEVLILS